MKVLTYNTRYDCIADGINRFEYRKTFILEKLEQEKPDIIGFQEVLPSMQDWFQEVLKEYVVLGCGRGADLSDETTAVAYRKDRFRLVAMETFWLSETPWIPGSRYQQQSICPRTCTQLLLHDLQTNLVLRVYNTHLDHEGEDARVLAMTQILNKMKQETLFPHAPVLLMGDFNAEPEAREVKLCEENTGLKELTKEADATFHWYGTLHPEIKIDYIFGSEQFVCKKCSLWKDKRGEMYLSDHYPVCVEIEVMEDGK